MTSIDWNKIAAKIDQDLELPKDWDSLSTEAREAHPYADFFKGVMVDYKKARIRGTVETMMIEPQEFIISSESDILNRRSPKWLVEDLIQENTICLFAAPGGLGKSFMALAIARAMASGGPFHGKKVQKGKTLYVIAEGAAAFGDRVRAWDHAHGILQVPGDAITYVEQGVNLKDASAVARLADMVREGDYSLVILDTLSQLAYFDNENNNAEVALTFRAIKSIRDAREGTSVLVIDHTPAGGGKARGATAKRDNSDTVIIGMPVSDNGEAGFSLSTRNEDGGKQKDGKALLWHGFALQSVLNSAIVVNNGGKRPVSPLWGKCLTVLRDGEKHGTTELREVCGIEGNMQSAEGKKLGREIQHWLDDGLIVKEGSTKSTTYRLSEQMRAVAE